jgi:hypothetical protein
MRWLWVWLLPALVSSAQGQPADCSPQRETVLELFHGRYSLQVSAFAQLQYLAGLQDGSLVRSDFSVPRARVCASGHAAHPSLRYRLMIGRSIQRELEVVDAFAEWQPSRAFTLRFGRFKLPIVREWIESAVPLATLDRSLSARALLPGRDYGLRIAGQLAGKRLEYLLGIWNGDGDAATRAADTRPALVARLGVQVLGEPIVGAVDFAGTQPTLIVESGAMWNRSQPPATAGAVVTAAERDEVLLNGTALFRWAGFDAALEYVGLLRWEAAELQQSHGGSLRITQLFPRLLSTLSARESLLIGRGKKPLDQIESEVDWGLYLDRHRAKLVLRYALLVSSAANPEHQLGAQVQIAVQ